MARQTYVQLLFAPVAEYADADDAWLAGEVRKIREGLTAGTTSKDLYKQVTLLPSLFLLEHVERFKKDSAVQALSAQTRRDRIYSIELRRMRLIFRLTYYILQETPDPTDFLDSLCLSMFEQALEVLKDEAAARELATSMVVYNSCLALHEIHGKPIYEPSKGLVEALSHTEFRDLPASQLRLPHNTLFIAVPPGVDLWIPHAESGQHAVCGIYLCARTSLSLATAPSPHSGTLGILVVLIGETKPNKFPSATLFNDALLHFIVTVQPGETIGTLLARVVSEVSGYNQQYVVAWNSDACSRVLRLVLNTLLYITLPDAEMDERFLDSSVPHLMEKLQRAPKGSSKRAKLNAELAKADKQRVIILGSSVKIDRSYAKESSRGSGSGTTGRKLEVQYIRRGHWRNQPYGPGRTLTRLQWIRPTAVGAKNAPMKNIVYELGESLTTPSDLLE